MVMEKAELEKQINETIMEMTKNPKDLSKYHKLSRLYLEEQDYDKVMSVLESILAIDPKDVQALVGMG